MKYILIFSNHFFIQPSGAAYSRMLNYAKALTINKGVKVIFCSFQHDKNINEIVEIDRNIFIAGRAPIKKKSWIKRRFSKFFAPIKSIIYLYRISSLLKKLKGGYAILVFSMKLFNDIFLLLKFKVLNKAPVYVEKNELIHSIYSFNYDKNTNLKQKVILYSVNRYKWILGYLNDLLVKFYDGAIVISVNIEKWVKRYNRNTIRIPILTDFDEISNRVLVKSNKQVDTFVVGYMGSINQKKDGVDFLLTAINKLNQEDYNIILNMYGPGKRDELVFLQNLLNKQENSSVFFKGNLPYAELINKYTEHDLLVLPRPYSKQGNYGFSTKLADYLASGIPVLATDISDNSLYIKNKVNGFLIKTADLIYLDKVIVDIMENKHLSSIGRKGRETAQDYFDYRHYSNSLYKFLQKRYESRDT
jgi:glycosyltransferase involved in cell wall biosynthesis